MAVTTAPRGARKTLVAGKTLADFPDIAAQLHPDLNGDTIADQIPAGTSTTLTWVCSAGADHVWTAPVVRRTSYRSGCPFCAGRSVSVTNSLAALFPQVAVELHPELNGGLTADQLLAGTNSKVWWRCAKDTSHVWNTSVQKRTRRLSGCPRCGGRARTSRRASATPPPGHSLAVLAPTIAAELDFDLNGGRAADQVHGRCLTKMWWRCDKGPDHVWETSPINRTRSNSGCPFCANKRLSVTNSLATCEPEIAAQLDPSLNDGLTADEVGAGSHRRVWWRCSNGPDHVWLAPVVRRTSHRHGCPSCSGHQLSVTNSLATLEPEIGAQLDPALNGGLTADQVRAGSHTKVWWRCARNADHTWEAKVRQRTSHRSGCPHCNLAGRSKFELQIASLIRARTGLHVDVDVKVEIPGQARREQVDLGIPELGFLIDLDPPYWHQDAERDQRKLHLIAAEDDRTYLRVRGTGTPHIRGNVIDAECTPEGFVEALRPFLEAFVPWRDLDSAGVAAARAAADVEWSELVGPDNEVLAEPA